VRLRVVVEEHGSGRQLLRARIWPRTTAGGPLVTLALLLLASFAWLQGRVGFATAIAVALLLLLALAIEGTATAMSLALGELGRLDDAGPSAVRGSVPGRPDGATPRRAKGSIARARARAARVAVRARREEVRL
jgi:hypothetical protein